MIISLTYKQILKTVKFPVYVLPSEEFYLRDGLLILNEQVVDDRNQSGDTLGKRRLQTPHKVKTLNKTYETFLDIVKETRATEIEHYSNVIKNIREEPRSHIKYLNT